MDVEVCRICLIMGVKLHDLRSYPLQFYYESVIGTNPRYATLPPFACYECAALVRKFYFFRQKCVRSQAVLFGTTDDYGKLNSSEVRLIDRKGLHIASNLTITVLPDLEILQNSNEEIKHDPDSENEEDKFEIEDHNYSYLLEDHNYALDPSLSSHNYNPLSVLKENKSQNKDSDDEKLDMKEEYKVLEFVVGTEKSGQLIEVPKVVERKQKHRLRKGTKHKKKLLNPSLAAESISDFAQNMTVTTLSLEEQKEEIQKRKESTNYLNSPFQCNLCYKGFVDNDAWDHHVSKHSVTAGSIECEVCKFRFKTQSAYYNHASRHKKKYACKSCPYVCTNVGQAKKHQGWHKGITFKCKYCDEIFTIWTSYMSHVRIKHPSQFICGFCGYSFVSKMGLAMHKAMMHKEVQENTEENVEEGPYCEECDVKFISTEAYKRHMVMSVKHTRSTDSIKGCRTCGATFENSDELRLHHCKEYTRKRPKNYRKKPNPYLSSWPAKCEHCPEEIPNAREYWTHFRRAHPDKKYPVQKNHVCEICGKCFKTNASLECHRRTHFEERAYKCSQCDKAFFNQFRLHVHETTHSDNRPYPCSVCFKAFKFKAALDRHFRIHTGQKPYECEVCGKRFSQSNSRKVHVRSVHQKQPAPYYSRNHLERRKQGPKEPPA